MTAKRPVEERVDRLWSKYCPACKTSLPDTQDHCPHDGTALRDHSLFTRVLADTGLITTGLPDDLLPLSERGPGLDPFSPGPVTIGSTWEITARGGGGTFGTFYVGRHAVLGRRVGIKVLRRRFTSTAEGRNLFHEEAMHVSRLNHPNIVAVFDYGEHEGQPYLVMEYLPGKPLSHYLDDDDLELEDAIDIIRQTAEALSAAHQGEGMGEPLVHLDLKPEHIFVERIHDRYHAKVIDFGIAEIVAAPSAAEREALAAVGSESENGGHVDGETVIRVTGTLPYMAPERWRGVADPRCDIYSLGIVLYELVGGRKPYVSRDPVVMRSLHESEPLPPLGRFRRARVLTRARRRELEEIIQRTLSKSPAERPSSARALADSLAALLEPPRRPPIAFLSATLAAVLAVVLGLFAFAPWASVTLLSKALLVGPKHAATVESEASWPYDNARARLRILDGGDEVASLDLGEFRDGVLSRDVSWDDLRGAVRRPSGDMNDEEAAQVLTAELLIRGWTREIVSRPVELRLDEAGPHVVEVQGAVRRTGTNALLVERASPLVRFVTDEELDPQGCRTIDGDEYVLAKLSPDARSAEWRLDVGDSSSDSTVRTEFVDLAGNKSSEEWTIQWIEDAPALPNLLTPSRGPILTSEASYRLELRFDRPARVTARTSDGVVLESAMGERAEVWTLVVPFTDVEPDTLVTKVVSVTFASAEIDRPPESSSNPDVYAREETFDIRHLARRLAIARRSADNVFELTVADGRGKRLGDDSDLVWDARLRVHDGESSYDFAPRVRWRGGWWILDDSEFSRIRGRVSYWVNVEDGYGNKSSYFMDGHSQSVEPPLIDRLVLRRPDGRPIADLHASGCGCEQPDRDLPLTLDAEVRYRYPESLRYRLDVPGRGEVSIAQRADSTSGLHFPIDRATLESLRRAPHGSPVLFVAVDERDPHLSSAERLEVGVDAPVDVRLSVFDGDWQGVSVGAAPVAVRRTDVRFRVSAVGESIRGARIAGKSYTIDERDDDGAWTADVHVDLAGETPMDVELELASGCVASHRGALVSRRRSGVGYVFELGGLGPIEAWLWRDGDAEFWHIPPASCAGLVQSVRESDEATDADGERRPTREEVSGLLVLLREGLSETERPQLPTARQCVALRRVVPAAIRRAEWIDATMENWDAVYLNSDDDPRGADADVRVASVGFRLLVPVDERGRLNPKNARRTVSAEDSLEATVER